MSHVITQLLSAPLLLHEPFAQQAIPYYTQLFQQLTQLTPAHANGRQTVETAAAKPALTAQLAVRGSAQRIAYMIGESVSLTENGVAIVNLTGPIYRYGFWWFAGTEDYIIMLNELLASPQIQGIVLVVDSPGGQASGIAGLYDAIALAQKPVIALVSGLAASAAYYAIAGATEIWASQKSDQIGSIGAYITLIDWSGAYAQMGVKLIEIYARVSEQKNAPGREALSGNLAPMQDMLDQLVGFFQQAVRDGRGERLVATDGLPKADNYFEGGVFWAEKAQALGLIDTIGTLQQAVDRVFELAQAGYTNPRAGGGATASDSTHNQRQEMAIFDKQPLITALKGVKAEDITAEQIQAINESLNEQGINLTVVSDAEATRLDGVETENTRLNAENTRLTTENARLGKQAGEKPSTPALAGQQATTETKGAESAGNDDDFYCETDKEIAQLKGLK